MPASEERASRSLLALALICCVGATCQPRAGSDVVEERRLSRVMADGVEPGRAVLPVEEAAGSASRIRGAESPGAAAEPGRAPVPELASAAAPAVSRDPAADLLAAGVRGRLTAEGSGLGGIEVRLETEDGDTLVATSYGGRADERGFFGFEAVPPGRHRLSLVLPDASGVAFSDTSRTVRVASARAVVREDFRGRLALDSRIRGTVRGTGGQPIAGVRVRVSGHALEGYGDSVLPSLASLDWAATVETGPDGRYEMAVPGGWYRVSIWRPEWLESPRFLRFQYRSPMPAVAPGDTATENFDFRRFDTAECVVDQFTYGDRVEREPGAMRCGEPLHPEVTRFEAWAFEGRRGDRVRIDVDLEAGAPLLVVGPEGDVLARDSGRRPSGGATEAPPADAKSRVVAVTLERDGVHRIVVTYVGPVSSTADSYRLRLSGPRDES